MKKCLSLFLALVMILTLAPVALAADPGLDNFQKANDYPAGLFTDVKDDAWYHDSVKSAYEFGLVRGVSENAFNPDGNMTLAEALALADRLHSIYNTGAADFQQGEPWYQVYVDYAAAKGIISSEGYPDYNAKATRAQFAQIFAKALPESALPRINDINEGMIPDVKGSDEYGPDVYMLYNAGILTGSDSAGTFNPSSNIKRSEVSAIVTRMADTTLRKSFTPVEKVDVTAVSLNKTNEQIAVGGILWITASVSPDNATDKTVTWSSSDPSVATVYNGKVTGIKSGSVTITAACSNGVSASCTVVVNGTGGMESYKDIISLWQEAAVQTSFPAMSDIDRFAECATLGMQDYYLWGGSFYYDYKDLNSDGTNELIISFGSYTENSPCAIYSIKDGVYYYYLFDYFADYSTVQILADGTIYTRKYTYSPEDEPNFEEYELWALDSTGDINRLAYYKEMDSSYYDIDGNKLKSADAIKALSTIIDAERMTFSWKLLAHNYAYDYMNEITDLMNTPGVNGLLHSAFTDVRKADISDVVYQLTDDSLDFYKVLSAYKKEYEFYDTSLTYMSKTSLDNFLKKYTGLGLADADWNLGYMNYVKSIDAYCIEHGDTNFQPVYEMTSTSNGDLFSITYFGSGDWFYYNTVTGNYGSSEYMTLTLRRIGPGNYQIISNLPS